VGAADLVGLHSPDPALGAGMTRIPWWVFAIWIVIGVLFLIVAVAASLTSKK
jgi:hypothetical protein